VKSPPPCQARNLSSNSKRQQNIEDIKLEK
jgi:hypothetical protein